MVELTQCTPSVLVTLFLSEQFPKSPLDGDVHKKTQEYLFNQNYFMMILTHFWTTDLRQVGF